MNRERLLKGAAVVGLIAVLGGAWSVLSRTKAPQTSTASDEPVRIRPDYVGVVIPPNIAPLNFVIENSGTRYFARIHGPQGAAVDLDCDDGRVQIPIRPWRRLLQANRGG
jgi:hypothetical protein